MFYSICCGNVFFYFTDMNNGVLYPLIKSVHLFKIGSFYFFNKFEIFFIIFLKKGFYINRDYSYRYIKMLNVEFKP